MLDIISFLNENSGAVQSIFAGIVALATTVYVLYTAKMFGQMRYSNQRLEAASVEALLEPGRSRGSLFELAIRNSGNVPVYDVDIEVDPQEFPGLTEQSLGDLALFKRSIPIMTEGQEIRTLLFHYQDYANAETESNTLTFSVSFKTPQGKEETRTYVYDLDIYMGLTDFSEKSMNDVTKELKDLNKELKKVSSGIKDVKGRLEWSMLSSFSENKEAMSPSIVHGFFLAYWEDFKSLGDHAFVGFSLHKMQAVCERMHNELSRTDSGKSEHATIRRNFLKMSRKTFYIDGGRSIEEFESLGDETAKMIRHIEELE